jgi:hypothetical protein
MGQLKWWAIGVGVTGTLAGIIAASLFWLLVTHPVTVARVMAKGL